MRNDVIRNAYMGSPQALIAMAMWAFVVLALFAFLPKRRALIASIILGWLFLPVAAYKVAGFIDLTKTAVVSLAALLAVLIVDGRRITSFRPRWFDVPMIALCLGMIGTSIANGLGPYDGFSMALGRVVRFGIPYFLGRIYCSDRDGIRDLAIGVFLGGLVYTPFCLYEIRMSPQLHQMFYGYAQHSINQQQRLGGWRPMVFMQHGLAVGMWLTAASVVGIGLWHSGALKRLAGFPVTIPLILVIGTALLSRSLGALILLAVGVALLLITHWLRSRTILVVSAIIPLLYISVRALGLWDGTILVETTEAFFGPARARSIEIRVDSEVLLGAQSREKPILGWGGWKRDRITLDMQQRVGVTDSLWIITFLSSGYVGLASILATLLMPVYLLGARIRKKIRSGEFGKDTQAALGPAISLAVVLVLWMVDGTLNSMINPTHLLIAGGLMGLVPQLESRTVRVRRAAQPVPRRRPQHSAG